MDPPRAGPGEVLVKVTRVGICGSELQGYLGRNSLRKPPLVMGHEFAGVVARAAGGFSEGTRVTVNPLYSCGTCGYCTHGRENLCASRGLIGVHRPGAFAEFVVVPEGCLYVLPEALDDTKASLAEPVAVGMRAIRLGAVRPGSHVVIFGFGSLGLSAFWAARQAGAEKIAVVDVNPYRLGEAKAQGADDVVDARTVSVSALIGIFANESRPEVAIDAVGNQSVRAQAIRVVRNGGIVVFLGLHEDESLLPVNEMVRREVEARGCFAYTKGDFQAALDLLSEGEYPVGSWLQEYPLSDGAMAFRRLLEPEVEAIKIVLAV
jgi:threonine dehydrogenase-like Zn-dependent dehydrogenase